MRKSRQQVEITAQEWARLLCFVVSVGILVWLLVK